MSHFINDQIADGVQMDVAAMSDHQVLNKLFEDHGIATPIDSSIVNPDDLAVLIDAKRYQLEAILFEEAMERPGPYG